MLKIDWIEIPAGQFIMGLSEAEKGALLAKVRLTLGIDQLPQSEQDLLESLQEKPYESLSDAELRYWKQLAHTQSPLQNYRDAFWVLRNTPERRVLSLPTFYIARFPITHAQTEIWYQSTLGKYAHRLRGYRAKQSLTNNETPDHPFQFDWDEADALAHWLGGRLPTVVEWEKAARGTDGGLYPWGNEWNPAFGNFWITGVSAVRARNQRIDTTAVDAWPEGASPYGVVDMVGNLAEWTATIDSRINQPIYKSNPWRYMPMDLEFCWATTTYQNRASFRHMDYVGCRPILTEWGRRLWPGYRSELE